MFIYYRLKYRASSSFLRLPGIKESRFPIIQDGTRPSGTIKHNIINISKGFRTSTDTFIGTFRRNLKGQTTRKGGAQNHRPDFAYEKRQRGCQGKLEGKTRLFNRRRVFTFCAKTAKAI